jgi:hypothetical protein
MLLENNVGPTDYSIVFHAPAYQQALNRIPLGNLKDTTKRRKFSASGEAPQG